MLKSLSTSVLGLVLMLLGTAHAACSGSGTTWTCTAGTTPAQVNTAISSASDGATFTFDAGSYTWGGTAIQPSASKALTLICTSQGACDVSASSTVFTLPSTDSTKLFRISGFDFTGNADPFMWTCPGGGCTNTWEKFRFDHNTVASPDGGDVFLVGETSANQYVYGVIDNNTFTSTGSVIIINWLNATDATPPTAPLGTGNNLFAEDNTVTFTSITNGGTGCTDHWGQSAIVWRYNTTTNCRIISHGVTHGGGPSNFEVYRNTIQMDSGATGFEDCYRCVHHQGSNTYMVWDNVFTAYSGKSSDAIVVLHYRDYWYAANGPGTLCGGGPNGYSLDCGILPCDGTYGSDGNRTGEYGYPCYRQPGRDVSGAYKPMYAFKNRWSDTGAKIDMVLNTVAGTAPPSCTASNGGTCDYTSHHMIAGREWFNAVSANAQTSASSPFDGSVTGDAGVGFGTLANRPTTCETATESGAGAGYWATDQGSWNSNGEDGVLYTCSATDTWSTYYTPYTYPHPLRNEGGGSTGGNLVIILADWAPIVIGLGLLGGLYASRTAWNRRGPRSLRPGVGKGRDPATARAA